MPSRNNQQSTTKPHKHPNQTSETMERGLIIFRCVITCTAVNLNVYRVLQISQILKRSEIDHAIIHNTNRPPAQRSHFRLAAVTT